MCPQPTDKKLTLVHCSAVTEKVNEEVSTDASEAEDPIPSKPEPSASKPESKSQPKPSPRKVSLVPSDGCFDARRGALQRSVMTCSFYRRWWFESNCVAFIFSD